MNVVLTNAESPQIVSMINSLGKKNIKVISLSSKTLAAGFYSIYSSVNYLHQPINYKNYTKESSVNSFINLIKKVTNKWSPSILIPNSELTLIPISKKRDEIDAIIPIPPHESIEISHKKWLTFKFLSECKTATPETFVPRLEDLLSISKQMKFPIMIKEAVGFGGGMYFICKNSKDLKLNYKKIVLNGKLPLVQEYIDGVEYSCIFVTDKNSKILGSLISEFHPADNDLSSYLIGKSNKNIEKISKKILKKLNWYGLVSLQFIVKGNKPYLIEINPRLGASIELAIRSGVDLPYILYCNIMGIPIKKVSFKEGLFFIYWYNGIFHHIKKYGLHHFLKLLHKNKIVFRMIFPDDPLPNFLIFSRFLRNSLIHF
jgi:predicted ATP-grasp superfamily ATP-dependent carboligase